MKQKLSAITEETLIDFFSGKKFGSLTARAARCTFRSDFESGFDVIRDLKNKFHYSQILVGTRNSMAYSEEARFKNFDPHDQDHYEFLDLHFHPSLSLFPSLEDLDLLNSLFYHMYGSRPIMAIGITYQEKGRLLLLQQIEFNSLLEDYDYHHYEDDSTEELCQDFNNTEVYKATSLEFKLKGSTIEIPDEQLERVKMFAYTPKIIR